MVVGYSSKVLLSRYESDFATGNYVLYSQTTGGWLLCDYTLGDLVISWLTFSIRPEVDWHFH